MSIFKGLGSKAVKKMKKEIEKLSGFKEFFLFPLDKFAASAQGSPCAPQSLQSRVHRGLTRGGSVRASRESAGKAV